MKNLLEELNELMQVAKVEGNKRNVFRREFTQMSEGEKSAFLDEFYWRIIQTMNPRNYVES